MGVAQWISCTLANGSGTVIYVWIDSLSNPLNMWIDSVRSEKRKRGLCGCNGCQSDGWRGEWRKKRRVGEKDVFANGYCGMYREWMDG